MSLRRLSQTEIATLLRAQEQELELERARAKREAAGQNALWGLVPELAGGLVKGAGLVGAAADDSAENLIKTAGQLRSDRDPLDDLVEAPAAPTVKPPITDKAYLDKRGEDRRKTALKSAGSEYAALTGDQERTELTEQLKQLRVNRPQGLEDLEDSFRREKAAEAALNSGDLVAARKHLDALEAAHGDLITPTTDDYEAAEDRSVIAMGKLNRALRGPAEAREQKRLAERAAAAEDGLFETEYLDGAVNYLDEAEDPAPISTATAPVRKPSRTPDKEVEDLPIDTEPAAPAATGVVRAPFAYQGPRESARAEAERKLAEAMRSSEPNWFTNLLTAGAARNKFAQAKELALRVAENNIQTDRDKLEDRAFKKYIEVNRMVNAREAAASRAAKDEALTKKYNSSADINLIKTNVPNDMRQKLTSLSTANNQVNEAKKIMAKMADEAKRTGIPAELPLGKMREAFKAFTSSLAADTDSSATGAGGVLGTSGSSSQGGAYLDDEKFNDAWDAIDRSGMTVPQLELLSRIKSSIQMVGKAREGGKLTDADLEFYQDILVNSQTPEALWASLNRLQSDMAYEYDDQHTQMVNMYPRGKGAFRPTLEVLFSDGSRDGDFGGDTAVVKEKDLPETGLTIPSRKSTSPVNMVTSEIDKARAAVGNALGLNKPAASEEAPATTPPPKTNSGGKKPPAAPSGLRVATPAFIANQRAKGATITENKNGTITISKGGKSATFARGR